MISAGAPGAVSHLLARRRSPWYRHDERLTNTRARRTGNGLPTRYRACRRRITDPSRRTRGGPEAGAVQEAIDDESNAARLLHRLAQDRRETRLGTLAESLDVPRGAAIVAPRRHAVDGEGAACAPRSRSCARAHRPRPALPSSEPYGALSAPWRSRAQGIRRSRAWSCSGLPRRSQTRRRPRSAARSAGGTGLEEDARCEMCDGTGREGDARD